MSKENNGERKINRIAVFTSGGDAPGMNAAIRAVVRTAAFHDLHVYGVARGYEGMIDGDFSRLESRDVANIIQRGGTILKTARSQRFMTPEGRKAAYDSLLADTAAGPWRHFDSADSLIDPLEQHWPVQRLRWFTHGWYAVGERNEELVLSDLRMGSEPTYVFRFAVAERDGHEDMVP